MDDQIRAGTQPTRIAAEQAVFDILNAGPRRRFTVRGEDGRCVIVSNCENVVMGLERQLLVRAMLRCEREGLPVIFNSYDEIVCEVPEDRARWETLEEIMTDPPPWAKEIRLPIAAEGWVGPRYRK